MQPYLPELQEAVDTLTANKENWIQISERKMPLPKAMPADDEKLGWSVNVGYLACGVNSQALRDAKPVEKLMSHKNDEYEGLMMSTE